LTTISAWHFARALGAIGRPDGRRLDILRAHYAAPGHAATATVLAEQVGYKNNKGIAVWYGQLARQITMLVGDESTNLSLLFEIVGSTTAKSGDRVLVMRPEFADGLKRAGWIEEQ
jgi:hypothetical protein